MGLFCLEESNKADDCRGSWVCWWGVCSYISTWDAIYNIHLTHFVLHSLGLAVTTTTTAARQVAYWILLRASWFICRISSRRICGVNSSNTWSSEKGVFRQRCRHCFRSGIEICAETSTGQAKGQDKVNRGWTNGAHGRKVMKMTTTEMRCSLTCSLVYHTFVIHQWIEANTYEINRNVL